MKNESEHQFLKRDFFIQFFRYKILDIESENGKEEHNRLFSSFFMPMGRM